MNETILSWNATNWITVIIMVTLGFTILAVLAQVFHSSKSGGEANA